MMQRRGFACVVLLSAMSFAGTTASAQRAPRPTPPAPVAGIDRVLSERSELALRVAGEPDWLAVHDGDVWTAAPKVAPNGAVLALHPRSGRVMSKIAVDAPCGPLISAAGSIWVHTCGRARSIVRVDPRRSRITATLPVGMVDPEGAFAFAEGAIWVITDTLGTLARVSVDSGTVLSTTMVAPRSFSVIAGAGSLWTVSTGPGGDAPGRVQRIDPRSGQVVASIPVGPGARFAAFGEESLWTLNRGDSTVSRVDPRRNREVARIPLGDGASYGDIAVGAGRVWVRTYEILLAEIDPRNNTVVARYREPAGTTYGAYGSGAVRVSGRSVWLSAHDVDSIWRIRAR